MAKKRKNVYNFGGALQTIGGIAQAIPGVGTVVGGVLNLAGGLVNRSEKKGDAIAAANAQQNQLALQKDSQVAQQNLQNQIYANGGNLLNRGINEFNVGLSHEQNPNGGIQLGQNNLVEEGETKGFATTKDYIFSDKLRPRDSDKTFADVSKNIEGKYKGYDTDVIALESKDRELSELRNQQENLKLSKFTNRLTKLQKDFPEQFGNVGGLNPLPNQQISDNTEAIPPGSHQMPDGTIMPGNTHQQGIELAQEQYKCGGKLKLQLGGNLNTEGDPPYNVLARTDDTGVWGNYTLKDPNAINQYNQDLTGNTKYQFGNRWKTLQGIEDIESKFTDADFEPFKEYYKQGVGSEYDPKVSFGNVKDKLREAATNRPGKSFPTNAGYGYTGPTTIPMLEAYLDQRDTKRVPTENNTSTLNSLQDNTVNTGPPIQENNIPINDNNVIDNNQNLTDNNLNYTFYGGEESLNIPQLQTDLTYQDNNSIDQFQTDNNQNLQNALGDQTNPNIGGQVTSGRPDLVGIAASAVPNLIQALGNRKLAKNLRYPRAQAFTYDPDFVDPTRAAQEVRESFGGVKDKIRQGSLGRGNYLSNLIGASTAESKGLANVHSRFANLNANIANQAGQFGASNLQRTSGLNAQLGLQEAQDIAGIRQNEIRNFAGAAKNVTDTFFADRRAKEQIAQAGGENFSYKYVGPIYNQKLVKVFKGNGFEYYEDPKTGKKVNINN